MPARDGALRVLRAAQAANVRRVVLTSSFAAIGYGHGGPGHAFTENDWTDLSGAQHVAPYPKSKTLAERAAWDYVAGDGAGLELAVVNPVGIFGPMLGSDAGTSLELLRRMLDGKVPGLPRLSFGIVDVRDVADLHVRAMTHPDAAGERFLAISGDFMSLKDMAVALKAGLGERARKVPTRELPDWLVRLVGRFDSGVGQLATELGTSKHATSAKAQQLLGWSPRSREEALIASAESLLAGRPLADLGYGPPATSRPPTQVAATVIARSRAAWSAAEPEGSSGSASSSARSAGMPSWTVPWPSTDAASASRGVSACSGCHGRPVVGRAVHGGGHGQPRVQRGDRRVGAERELDAGVEHRAEHEAAVGPVRPALLGDVAVVEQVRRLHARPQAEPGHARRRRRGSSAGRARSSRAPPVAAYAASASCTAASPIAWVATSRPCSVATGQQRRRSSAGGRGWAAPLPGRVGVRRAAPRRAGVERAVGDDLQRPHRHAGRRRPAAGRRCAARRRGTPSGCRRRRRSAPAAGAAPAAERAAQSAGPLVELQVDQPDDPERRGGAPACAGTASGPVVRRARPARSSRTYAANHSVSATTPCRGGRAPGRPAPAELTHAWWPSPLIRTTGRSPETRSSSSTVGGRVPRRRAVTPADHRGVRVARAAARSPGPAPPPRTGCAARSSRAEVIAHWPRWTCWSHSPGISHRPWPSYSGTPAGRSRPDADLGDPLVLDAHVDGLAPVTGPRHQLDQPHAAQQETRHGANANGAATPGAMAWRGTGAAPRPGTGRLRGPGSPSPPPRPSAPAAPSRAPLGGARPAYPQAIPSHRAAGPRRSRRCCPALPARDGPAGPRAVRPDRRRAERLDPQRPPAYEAEWNSVRRPPRSTPTSCGSRSSATSEPRSRGPDRADGPLEAAGAIERSTSRARAPTRSWRPTCRSTPRTTRSRGYTRLHLRALPRRLPGNGNAVGRGGRHRPGPRPARAGRPAASGSSDRRRR